METTRRANGIHTTHPASPIGSIVAALTAPASLGANFLEDRKDQLDAVLFGQRCQNALRVDSQQGACIGIRQPDRARAGQNCSTAGAEELLRDGFRLGIDPRKRKAGQRHPQGSFAERDSALRAGNVQLNGLRHLVRLRIDAVHHPVLLAQHPDGRATNRQRLRLRGDIDRFFNQIGRGIDAQNFVFVGTSQP